MTKTPHDPQDISTAIEHVNEMGSASEHLFRRIYRGIMRRNRPSLKEQTQVLERRLRLKEEEDERLNGILAAIDQGVIMQDNEGRVVIVNATARNLLGSIKTFWESELGTLFNNYRDIVALDAEISPLSEPTRVQVNNRVIGAQLAAVADEHGQRLGTLIVLRDVTKAVVSERLKDQFITAMSHELRTPMTVIKGMTDLIAEHVEAGTNPDPRLLDTLTRNVDILDRMIVELLDVSELNTEDISVRQDRLALEELLWRVVEGLSPETRRSGLDVAVMLRHPDELYVKGDDQKLRWAMGHLLENSIRYTEPGGHIFFIAGKHDERHVSIQVVDTGVGISDRDLPHIFDQFYRGEPRTPSGKLIDPRGLGQGLYIARRVTEAHGGYLSVKSTPGQGTIFTVVLPAA